MTDARKDWIAAAFLVFVVSATTYYQVFSFDFLNHGDDSLVLHNPSIVAPDRVSLVRHLATPYLGHPVPIPMATFLVEHELVGFSATVFHLTNLLLHCTVALLVLATARRLGCGPWVSAVAALLFAVHPVTSGSVCWISGRGELLAALFSVLALRSFLGVQGDPARRRLPTALLLLLAVLSSPTATFLSLGFLVLDAGTRPRLFWGTVQATAVVLPLLSWFLRSPSAPAVGPDTVEAIITRILASAGHLGEWLFVPLGLTAEVRGPAGGPDALTLAGGGIVLCLWGGLLAWTGWKRHPSRFGLLLALVAWLPLSGILHPDRAYATRNVYLPLVFLAFAAAPGLEALAARAGRRLRIALAVVAFAVLSLSAIRASREAETWVDGVSLWSATYRAYPDDILACRNLGIAWTFGKWNEPEHAIKVLRKCIATHGNRDYFLKPLAIATFEAGNLGGSLPLFREYRQAHPEDPTISKYLGTIECALDGGN